MTDAKSRVDQIAGDLAADITQEYLLGFENSRARCESPIEELLLAALHIKQRQGLVAIEFLCGDRVRDPYCDETIYVRQQIKVGEYRVDFLIQDASLPFDLGKPRLMIVECDGHEFHERTKKQAQRDKRRDRYFQSLGYRVLRFTGSEIWADPEACADEIIDNLAMNDGSQEGWVG